MKARKIRLLTILFASVLLILAIAVPLSSCSSRNTAKFAFELKDAKIEYSEAVGVHYASITVVTTCVSGRLYEKDYPHNAEGGKPWILDGEVSREGHAQVNAMMTELDIRKGDVIEYTWTFDIPRTFLEGEYDVRVEWFGTEQVFEKVNFSAAK